MLHHIILVGICSLKMSFVSSHVSDPAYLKVPTEKPLPGTEILKTSSADRLAVDDLKRGQPPHSRDCPITAENTDNLMLLAHVATYLGQVSHSCSEPGLISPRVVFRPIDRNSEPQVADRIYAPLPKYGNTICGIDMSRSGQSPNGEPYCRTKIPGAPKKCNRSIQQGPRGKSVVLPRKENCPHHWRMENGSRGKKEHHVRRLWQDASPMNGLGCVELDRPRKYAERAPVPSRRVARRLVFDLE